MKVFRRRDANKVLSGSFKGFMKVLRGRDANKIISGGLKGFMKVLRDAKGSFLRFERVHEGLKVKECK